MTREARMNTILLVDDSQENLDALGAMLEGLYQVCAAKNGRAALRIMEKVKPDLVLLDVIMPEMDGFEVLRRMKGDRRYARIPVIFITSDTQSISEAHGLLLGAADYIAKPYDPDIVSIKVKNQLENKLYRDELERLVEQRTEELVLSQNAIILGMSLMAESRDAGSGEHLKHIQRYVGVLAGAICQDAPELLSPSGRRRVVALSPLHDIGKVAISDNILLKAGALTDEEFAAIRAHTTCGGDILRKTQRLLPDGGIVLDDAVAIAECHHEKFDGSGYPCGLCGGEIPLSARIVALADVYDALTSDRPYKSACGHEEAMDIIVNGDGRTMPAHFDPLVLDTFKARAEEFRVVCGECARRQCAQEKYLL